MKSVKMNNGGAMPPPSDPEDMATPPKSVPFREQLQRVTQLREARGNVNLKHLYEEAQYPELEESAPTDFSAEAAKKRLQVDVGTNYAAMTELFTGSGALLPDTHQEVMIPFELFEAVQNRQKFYRDEYTKTEKSLKEVHEVLRVCRQDLVYAEERYKNLSAMNQQVTSRLEQMSTFNLEITMKRDAAEKSNEWLKEELQRVNEIVIARDNERTNLRKSINKLQESDRDKASMIEDLSVRLSSSKQTNDKLNARIFLTMRSTFRHGGKVSEASATEDLGANDPNDSSPVTKPALDAFEEERQLLEETTHIAIRSKQTCVAALNLRIEALERGVMAQWDPTVVPPLSGTGGRMTHSTVGRVTGDETSVAHVKWEAEQLTYEAAGLEAELSACPFDPASPFLPLWPRFKDAMLEAVKTSHQVFRTFERFEHTLKDSLSVKELAERWKNFSPRWKSNCELSAQGAVLGMKSMMKQLVALEKVSTQRILDDAKSKASEITVFSQMTNTNPLPHSKAVSIQTMPVEEEVVELRSSIRDPSLQNSGAKGGRPVLSEFPRQNSIVSNHVACGSGDQMVGVAAAVDVSNDDVEAIDPGSAFHIKPSPPTTSSVRGSTISPIDPRQEDRSTMVSPDKPPSRHRVSSEGYIGKDNIVKQPMDLVQDLSGSEVATANQLGASRTTPSGNDMAEGDHNTVSKLHKPSNRSRRSDAQVVRSFSLPRRGKSTTSLPHTTTIDGSFESVRVLPRGSVLNSTDTLDDLSREDTPTYTQSTERSRQQSLRRSASQSALVAPIVEVKTDVKVETKYVIPEWVKNLMIPPETLEATDGALYALLPGKFFEFHNDLMKFFQGIRRKLSLTFPIADSAQFLLSESKTIGDVHCVLRFDHEVLGALQTALDAGLTSGRAATQRMMEYKQKVDQLRLHALDTTTGGNLRGLDMLQRNELSKYRSNKAEAERLLAQQLPPVMAARETLALYRQEQSEIVANAGVIPQLGPTATRFGTVSTPTSSFPTNRQQWPLRGSPRQTPGQPPIEPMSSKAYQPTSGVRGIDDDSPRASEVPTLPHINHWEWAEKGKSQSARAPHVDGASSRQGRSRFPEAAPQRATSGGGEVNKQSLSARTMNHPSSPGKSHPRQGGGTYGRQAHRWIGAGNEISQQESASFGLIVNNLGSSPKQ